jgi:glycosyltransferase involved in cell wall biosynthesis
MADELTAKLETPVLFMAQATDAHRFGHAEPDPELRSDVLFVGNSRGHRRPVVDWAIESGLPLTLYGSGWDGLVAPDKIRDSYFPNERLGALYASAKVVLNDHWPDMKRMGIASNRIFDALASGSVVISDAVEGLAELFEGTVPTFDSAESLADTVHRHLDDSEMRAALARRGREIVLSNHTFDHRAAELAAIIRPMLQGRARACAGVRFDLSPELDGERPPSAHE